MVKKILITAILAIAVLFILSVSAIFISGSLRYFLYKEISYQYLADNIAKGAKNNEEIALKTQDYIHYHLTALGRVVDKDSWNDLVRGIAWCDQQSWALATLLAKENISARIVMLKDKNGVSPHTIAEVFLDGKWRVFDPLNGLVFRKSDGSLATLEEISQDPALITQNPKVEKLPHPQQEEFIAWYARMFPVLKEPKIWGSLLEKKNSSPAQKLVNGTIAVLVRSLDGPFVRAYQDLFLLANTRSIKDRCERLYFNARNYHLYSRIKLADQAYEEVIKQCPNSEYSENSFLFLGALKVEKEDYKGAIEELEGFFKQSPNSTWKSMGYYYLGRAYEGLNDFGGATANFMLVNPDLDTDVASRISVISNKK